MQPNDQRPSVPHDNAPFTMPTETAEKITAYGRQGTATPADEKTPVLEARDITKYFGRVSTSISVNSSLLA